MKTRSFSEVPGAGKKTARQMILDLKGKLADVVPDAFVDLFSDEERFDEKKGSSAELDEALEALRALDTQNEKFLALYQSY